MHQVDHFIDESPSNVKSLNDGWLTTYRTVATIVSHRSNLRVASCSYAEICAIVGLLAVTADILLTFIKDPAHYTHLHTRAVRRALLAFSYGALSFGSGATINAVVLTNEFGDSGCASQKVNPIKQGLFDSSSASLLEGHGVRRSCRWVMWHGTSRAASEYGSRSCITHHADPDLYVPGFGVLPRIAISLPSRRSSTVRSSFIVAATPSQNPFKLLVQ
jgi:hypothetical protein